MYAGGVHYSTCTVDYSTHGVYAMYAWSTTVSCTWTPQYTPYSVYPMYCSLQYIGYSESWSVCWWSLFTVSCTVDYSTLYIQCMLVESTHTLGTVNPCSVACTVYSTCGYSEYGVYACGVYSTLDTVNTECMHMWIQCTAVHIGYSEYSVYACGVYSTLDTVNPVYCRLHQYTLQYITGYSEYGVYAGGVYSTLDTVNPWSVCWWSLFSTLDTVNIECMLVETPQYTGYSESCTECMLVESVSVHWIQ